MKSTAIERRAETLRLYTRLPWQVALHKVKAAAPGTPLIPEPNPQQALLECLVLHSLAWPSIFTLRPWGIRHVDPQPHCLKIRFEDEIRRPDPAESMARWLAAALLPRADASGDIYGIPGARTTFSKDAVVLRRPSSPASVLLSGVSPEDWLTAVEQEDQVQESEGMISCHRQSPHQWTRTELDYVGENPWHQGLISESAWLASGLLRRVGLIRTIGVPLYTTAWTNAADGAGEEWIIEHEHESAPDAPQHHRRFMALLTAPEWGLPLTETHQWCSCSLTSDYDSECRLYARSTNNRPGELQMRFTRRMGDRLTKRWQRWPEQEVAARRLYVRLPQRLESKLADSEANA